MDIHNNVPVYWFQISSTLQKLVLFNNTSKLRDSYHLHAFNQLHISFRLEYGGVTNYHQAPQINPWSINIIMSFKLDKHVKELEYLDLCNGRNRFAIGLGLAIEIEPTQISVGSVCEKFVGTLYTGFPPSCGKKIKGNFKFFRSMETMCMYTVQDMQK